VRPSRSLAAVVLPIGLLASALYAPAAGAAPAPTREAAGSSTFVDTDQLSDKYLRQGVNWSEANCSEADRNRRKDPALSNIAYRQIECARITVPLNYQQPDRFTLELYALRVRAAMSNGENGRPLLVNRGGPGGTATDYAMTLANRESSLLETHDFIGVDPRGIGQSSPVACNIAPLDPERYEPGASIDKGTDWPCVRKHRQAAFLGTENVARDFDLVRKLLNQDKIDYYGASYGTQLGRTYQSLFPSHAGRFVLDSNTPPPGTLQASGGFDRRASQLREWLARNDREYRLGATAAEVAKSYQQILNAAAEGALAPVAKAGIESAWTAASYNDTVFQSFAKGLSTAKRYIDGDRNVTMQNVRDGLYSANAQRDLHTFYQDGSGGILVKYADMGMMAVDDDGILPASAADYFRLLSSIRQDASVRANLESLSQSNLSTADLIATITRLLDDIGRVGSDLTPGQVAGVVGYMLNVVASEPVLNVLHTVAPILRTLGITLAHKVPAQSPLKNTSEFPFALMLQAEYDPATTWEDALASLKLLPNSRMVAIRGAGTHGVLGNKTCADLIVYRYLQRGERPASHKVCDGQPMPGDDKIYPGPMIAQWQAGGAKPEPAPVTLSPTNGSPHQPGTEARDTTGNG